MFARPDVDSRRADHRAIRLDDKAPRVTARTPLVIVCGSCGLRDSTHWCATSGQIGNWRKPAESKQFFGASRNAGSARQVSDRAFLKSDGRSTRSLGHYPRVAHGRLIAVHVQEEITFCEIAKSDFSGPIPEGSHLELIPIGTISYLVERSWAFAAVWPRRPGK